MKIKICKLCGQEFTPKSSRQLYCKRSIVKICPVCGDSYVTECSPNAATTCSNSRCKKMAGYASSVSKKRICKICGSEFKPTSNTQEYCNRLLIKKCLVCGEDFKCKCNANYITTKTCSRKCADVLASNTRQLTHMNKIRICELCGKEFNPRSNTQKVCDREHFSKCVVCGKEFKLNYKSSIGQVDLRKTCSDECKCKLLSQDNAFSRPEISDKIKQTMLSKYGVEHPSQSKDILQKMWATYEDNTGYDHPSHNPNSYKRRHQSTSSLESKLANVLLNNNIEFEVQKQVSKDNIHHKFDFYLSHYNVFVDVDGEYYHGYLNDSNGKQVSEDRDDIRTYLIEDNQAYFIITESNLKRDIDELLSILKSIDSKTFSYEEYMFNWCRKLEFPYPKYADKRLHRDYDSLCRLDDTEYDSHCKLSMSTIRHFHRSIYDARVGNSMSLKEAWNSDSVLKKVINNRMLYINNVDPSKVLAGFYISKVVPKVSVFNPVLARYLTLKYLNEFNEVVDPFSGFSGRMLGVCSTGKRYSGKDLNESAVDESNQIIRFHNLNASISVEDLLGKDDVTESECLLTCPPYFNKETYSTEKEYKTCDEWIDIVLAKYKCNKYIFVVDKTDKYVGNVVETLLTRSYFNDVSEYVLVFDNHNVF